MFNLFKKKINTTVATLFKHENNDVLTVGQKVECDYYYEYDDIQTKCYKRPLLQRLSDRRFSPVKHGIIVGNAGVHPYWLAGNYLQQYLFVKFAEYKYDKAIPISCIKDAKKSAEVIERLLSENKHRIGEKGYDVESFAALTSTMNKAKDFTK